MKNPEAHYVTSAGSDATARAHDQGGSYGAEQSRYVDEDRATEMKAAHPVKNSRRRLASKRCNQAK